MHVQIAGVLGNTNANGSFRITVVDANRFSLQNITSGANIAGNGAYAGGGTFASTFDATSNGGNASPSSTPPATGGCIRLTSAARATTRVWESP
jgi:hypothetical protein